MFIIYKMKCQQLIIYGLIALVGLYVLRETMGVKLPFIDGVEGFDLGGLFGNSNSNSNSNVQFPSVGPSVRSAPAAPAAGAAPSAFGEVLASEGLGRNERYLPVSGINRTPTSCYPQNTLQPDDLLPSGKSKQIQDFDNANPTGEGILKGVNFLDAGFHVGVNTVGQSLRNANRQVRAEPPNPQVAVSPWMNTTIGPDLIRKPLEDEDVCVSGKRHVNKNNDALNVFHQ